MGFQTATLVRRLDSFSGDAALYRLSSPIVYERWNTGSEAFVELEADTVIVSAVNVRLSGPETYVFKAGTCGCILEWCELPGSYRGGLSHARALNGYTIIDETGDENE